MIKDRVIISLPFKGMAETYIDKEGNISKSECKTFEEYRRKTRKRLRAITWEEYDKLHAQFYHQPFIEISRTQYEAAGTMVKRMSNDRYIIKFTERVSGVFHKCYAFDKNLHKYYYGVKSLLEELFDGLLKA